VSLTNISYNSGMNILGLLFVLLLLTIVILTRDDVFGGRTDILKELLKELATRKAHILKNKPFIAAVLAILIGMTARTNIFDKIEIFKSIGLSPDKKIVITQKHMTVTDESAHFLFGAIIGFAFDSWTAAFGIGCMKEISDFIDHYYHHTVDRPQIIHDGILDPLYWMFGGIVGHFSLGRVHLLLKGKKKITEQNMEEDKNE
jgi:hypothetical protein